MVVREKDFSLEKLRKIHTELSRIPCSLSLAIMRVKNTHVRWEEMQMVHSSSVQHERFLLLCVCVCVCVWR